MVQCVSILQVIFLKTLAMAHMHITFVTVYGKTRHMGFSVKIELDASLISSTLESYPTCKIEAARALRLEDSALCSRSRYSHKNRVITV